MKRKKLEKQGSLRSQRISVSSTIILILIILITMFPFYIMFVGAFKKPISLVTYPIDLNPFQNLTLKNVQNVLKSDIFLWLKNTIVISVSAASQLR